MHHNFWHERWQKSEIGFHENAPNQLLLAHFSNLNLSPDQRIFLPLCGKTRDIHWLLQQGFQVAGAELSEIAVQQLFEDLGITPQVSFLAQHKLYSAPALDIFVGDFFALSKSDLGPVQGVYDRAALVALPSAMRAEYSKHLVSLTNEAPQLLITFEYDQSHQPGPPFSVPADEVHQLYKAVYQPTCLQSQQVVGGLKGQTPAIEKIWHLLPSG